MLRNCFLDFAVEHWFGCRTTEPGFAGDIGAIEVWLIDWLIDICCTTQRCLLRHCQNWKSKHYRPYTSSRREACNDKTGSVGLDHSGNSSSQSGTVSQWCQRSKIDDGELFLLQYTIRELHMMSKQMVDAHYQPQLNRWHRNYSLCRWQETYTRKI